MARKKKRRSRNLVLGYLEKVSSKVFSDYPKEITHLAARQHGVYALYKGDHLYYVGLATNLRGRINHHQRDRHKGKWDNFSIYLVRKSDHIRELESLILRIADPKGNKVKGRLPRADNLKPKLRSLLRKAHDEILDDILKRQTRTTKSTGRKKRSKGSKSGTGRGDPPLAPYVKEAFQIRAKYKGKTYTARVRKDGKIRYQGIIYNSPSLAGKPIVHRTCNGWSFWRFKNKQGEWVRLHELRKSKFRRQP